MQEISTKNWVKIGVLGIIWGASFLFASVALTGAGPFFVAAVRIVLGAAFLLCLLRIKGRKLPHFWGKDGPKIWAFALIMALFSNVFPFILLAWALQSVASGFAGVCMAAVPLLILPLAHFLVPGERMSLRRLVGFVLGSVGVVVLIGPDAFTSTGKDMESLARLALLVAAGGYAIGSIATRLSPEVDRLSLSALVLTLAAGIIAPVALIVEGLPNALNVNSLLAMLYLGILPTGLAQLLLVQVNREAGPSFFSLVNYMVPVWSVILGAVVLSEALPPSLLAAMTLILGGVGLSQWGALRRVFGRR